MNNQKMFKKVYKSISSILFVMILVIIAGCGGEGGGEGDNQSSGIIPLYSPGVGGTNYIISAGIGKIMDDSDELSDAQLSTQSTNGSSEIIKSVSDQYEKGTPAFGTPASDIATRMYNGDWEPIPGEFTELRAVARISYAATHVVVPANSSIQSFADLEGKQVGIAPQGSSPYNFMSALLEEGYGLVAGEDYSAIPLGNPDIQDGIKDGSIDAGVLTGSIPASLVTELASTEDIRIISADKEELDAFLEDYPYYASMEIEAGTYPDQDEAITIGIFQTMLMTHEDVDEDLVYTVIKEMWENSDELEKVHPAFSLDENNALDGIEIPLHDGAKKFYEEIDVSVE